MKTSMFLKRSKTVVFTELGGYFPIYFPSLILAWRIQIKNVYISDSSKTKYFDLLNRTHLSKIKLLAALLLHKKYNECFVYGYFFLFIGKFKLYDPKSFIADKVDYLSSLGFLRKIPENQISLSKYSSNIHWSLLPKFAGMHPVYWTIMKGERYFGYTIHEVNKEFDRGNILLQERFSLDKRYTVIEINSILIKNSRKAFSKYIRNLEFFKRSSIPQQVSEFKSICKKPNKKDLFITENDSKEKIIRKFRASALETLYLLEGEEVQVIGVEDYIYSLSNTKPKEIKLNGLRIFCKV